MNIFFKSDVFTVVFVSLYIFLVRKCIAKEIQNERSFTVDYSHNQFLKDGKPFRYVSGSMHYFRVPEALWEDRLWKIRAAGLNAVQTYVEWSLHEPFPNVYNFQGNADLIKFIQLAQKWDLVVILRLGPFIDAERDMGGFPFWLLRENNSAIRLRTSDPNYLKHVKRWFSVLLPKIRPLLYSQGGPVIMLQVENEYGSYPACDYDYTNYLRDLIYELLPVHENPVVLFTTDGNWDGVLRCGKIPHVYATVDFGSGVNVTSAFKAQRNFEPWGPLVNSEFYPGWLDLWGSPHSTVPSNDVALTLDAMLSVNASVNIYVFHGGTSFGFTSGATPSDPYKPCPTSYDYDAPLSEAGDPTEKYFKLRTVIGKYLPLPKLPVPTPAPKGNYGNVVLDYVMDLWSVVKRSSEIEAKFPVTFEALGQSQGLMGYCTELKGHFPDPAVLEAKGLADRGYVYFNETLVGILSRSDAIFSLPLSVTTSGSLCILVENQGRISVGQGIHDRKGLTTNVTLNKRILSPWTMYPVPFNDTRQLRRLVRSETLLKLWSQEEGKDDVNENEYPTGLFYGVFTLKPQETVRDTFLYLPGWTKGVAFINEFNLGRYWPVQGPQVTLYVPRTVLNSYPNKNRIVLFEQEASPTNRSVTFSDQPFIDGETAGVSLHLFHKHF